jgi:Tfp pilus assembly protein FimT
MTGASHPEPRRGRAAAGFTILELLVVIFIMLAMTGIAVAAFRKFLDIERIRLAGGQVVSSLSLARQYAMSKRSKVMVEFVEPTHTETAQGFQPGVKAEFFYRSSASAQYPSQTGEVAGLTRTDLTINYPSTTSAWPGLSQNDNFAARFTGLVQIATGGDYTFYTSSDDGSQLWINEALVVNNDGWHGMQERSGIVTLPAGNHQIRVEMYEGGGDAGLVVSYAGPGVAKQVIPSSVLVYEVTTETDTGPTAEDDHLPRQVRILPYLRKQNPLTGGFNWLLEEDENALRLTSLPAQVHYVLLPCRSEVYQYDPTSPPSYMRKVRKVWMDLWPDGSCTAAPPNLEGWSNRVNTVIIRDTVTGDVGLMFVPPASAFTRNRYLFGDEVNAFQAAHSLYSLW